MISVKTGTQTWSKAEQRTDFDRDNRSSISASDKAKFFGDDENVGETLNKIADPNWVDPSKKMRTAGNDQLGKDAFMNLLLTQMKNQDPTNPLKSHEMAAQLAQFTSLEKLSNIDSGIEGLAKAQKPGENFAALNLLGKSVAGDSGQISRVDEKESHEIKFKLPADAVSGTAVIKDANGEVVKTLKLKGLKAGDNKITWNGQNEEGRALPVGQYQASFEAQGSNGSKMFVDTKFAGVISGVNFTANGPVLMVGKQTIPLSDIKEIVDPNLAAKAVTTTQAMSGLMPANLQQPAVQASGVKPEANKKAPPQISNMENVAMSRDMINSLKKTGIKAGI